MHIVLFDNSKRGRLYPITLTRAVGAIRFGILTIKERWEHLTSHQVSILTDGVLQGLYGNTPSGDCMVIEATILPSAKLISDLLNLSIGECLVDNEGFIAGRTTDIFKSVDEIHQGSFTVSKHTSLQRRLEYPHQIFQYNDEFIRLDYALITNTRISATLNFSVQTQNDHDIFIEEGAAISHSILNASTGPIYIGKNVTIMEGSLLRGPVALCEGATVKMGAKIYGATTVGPNCVVGGEIKNAVLFANSNKAHDGYLGDSVIGEWCNLGAGTSNSNVKNTGGEVTQWNYLNTKVSAGRKCGVIMGDYSRTAINTSINTGTVIGVCCNVFGNGLTPKFIPDFSWGMNGDNRYVFEKAIIDIDAWKKMKKKIITEQEAKVLKHIFENSAKDN